MKTGKLSAALATVVLMVAAPASAGRLQPRVVAAVDLHGLYSSRGLRLVDRARAVYLGVELKRSRAQHILSLVDYRTRTIEPPTPPTAWTRLAFLDSTALTASVLEGQRGGRTYFVEWSMGGGAKVRRVDLGEGSPWPIAAARGSATRWFLRTETTGGPKHRATYWSVIAVDDAPRPIFSKLMTKGIEAIEPDPERERALVLEYAESPEIEGPPLGYVIELRTGRVHSFQIPPCPYGAAFGADPNVVYVLSAIEGHVSAFDIRTGKRIRRATVRKLGHALGFVTPRSLVVVRHWDLRVLTPKSLETKRLFSTSPLFRGADWIHLSGSLVAPGHVLLKNGDVLKVVTLSKR